MPQQELGEAIIFELQAKEQAIRDSEEHLAALKEELFLTEQQLRDASDQLERVQKAIQHQGKHLGDKEKKILDTIDLKMKFIRDLEKLAADLENKMNEVGDDIRQKEDELEALRQNLESTSPDDKAYSELLDGFVTKEQQLKNVMNDFDKLKNEYDKVIEMLRQEMADVKKLEDDQAALRDKAKKDEEKLKEDLQDLVKELTRQLDEMKGEANQQKKRIGELQQEKEQLGRKVKELQQQMGPASELKERAAKLQKQLQDTQAALDHEKQRSGATRLHPGQADDNDAKLKETKERLHATQNDVDKLRKALDKLKKQQQADRQAADDRIKKEQEKVEKALQAAREMGDKERQRRDLELQVDALKAENASFADRLREAEKELDKWHMGDSLDKEEVLRILGDLVDDIDRGDVRVMSPLVEHDDLDKALASLQKRYNDILGALQRERQGSQKDRRATDSEIQALEGRLADTENALQKTIDKANQLERANKVKDDDLKQMADDLRKLKDKLSGQKALGEELDKERSAHAMAVRELEAQLEQMKDKFRKTRAGLEKELANARAPLLEKISNLEDAIRPLQQKLSKAVGEVDRLTAEKDAAVSDQGELEHQIAGLLKALQEAEDRARDAEARLGREKRRLEGKVRDLEDELRRVKGQLKNLKEDADIQLQRQQAKRDAEMQSLGDELKRVKGKLKDVQENAAIEAARNKQREERKVRELEDELLGLMDDLKKRVDQLGRAQDEAATLRNLLNHKESQLKTAAQREREQQARLRGIEEQLNKLRRLQHDIGAQTLQSELEKELKSVKDEQRRAAARGAAARELDAAQEQIAALQTLLRDKDKQLQDAMRRGSNNSGQLAARRDELSNLAAALREQSAEIGRLKTMFGQQFPFRADGLRQSPMNVSALAIELESLRNTVRDREQQIKDLLEHSGSQFPPGTLFPASLKENQTTFIPVGGGTAATTAGDSTMITTAPAAPGSGVFPAERNGAVPMASEIHHHHHHLRKTSPRGTKKSVSIRNQDSTLSPVTLAASAITSSTPGQVHHHHYSVGPHGKERTRMRKQVDALFCNVPYHEELETEVEELERMLDANPASSHRIKNARDRESLRMELQDLEEEVEDAMKRRSSLKRTQHQALDATLAKFQDHLLTLMDHKVRLSTSH